MKINKHMRHLRYRIEWFFIKSMQLIAPLLPRALIVMLSEQIGKLAFVFDTRGRITGIANSKCVMESGELVNINTQEMILKSGCIN